MKFRTLCAVASAVLMSACQQVAELESGNGNKELSFKVGFDVDKSAISRSALGNYISTLQVFDYKDGELANEIIQSSEDEEFGTVTLGADYGTHDYVFVGHNSVTCSYDNGKNELTFDKILDTFTAAQTLTVDLNTDKQQNIEMLRQVAGIKLVMFDAIPQNASSIELTINGYSTSLNPNTGLGSSTTEHVRKWEYSTSNIGKTNTNYTLYTFLPKEGHTVDITIRIEGTDGENLVNYTLENISVEKNRMTVISGYFLSMELSASVQIDGEWGNDIEVNI
ncbi:MAG: hypothetical protein J6B82_06150 [Bacteroidaceae bacterium]|nr:hypothetical protein [Bacteroidaceae bacterium]